MAVLYQHHDGAEIGFSAGQLVVATADDVVVGIPIGPAGMVALAQELLALASERQGTEIASELVAVLADAHDSQSNEYAFYGFKGALLELAQVPNREVAAEAFVEVIMPFLELGMEAEALAEGGQQ